MISDTRFPCHSEHSYVLKSEGLALVVTPILNITTQTAHDPERSHLCVPTSAAAPAQAGTLPPLAAH